MQTAARVQTSFADHFRSDEDAQSTTHFYAVLECVCVGQLRRWCDDHWRLHARLAVTDAGQQR